jgi:hypothetical protein
MSRVIPTARGTGKWTATQVARVQLATLHQSAPIPPPVRTPNRAEELLSAKWPKKVALMWVLALS